MLLPLLALGIIGGIVYMATGGHPLEVLALPGAEVPDSVSTDPFGDLPATVQGAPHRTQETGASTAQYVVDSYPPDLTDRTYHVAQLQWPLPPGVAPYSSWVAYWQDRESGVRELHRLYASPDDDAVADQIEGIMAGDFGLQVA